MPILRFPKRHSNFTAQADAYADGELHGGALERFETHLAACGRCAHAVAAARELKAALGALPEVPTPRSFRITPAMLERDAPRQSAPSGTPLYLGLARATAALSVAAFASAFILVSLDSSDDSADETAGAARDAADGDSALVATLASGGAQYESAAPEAGTTPQIAPASTGGAAGSGIEPPKTGADTVTTDRAVTVPAGNVPSAAGDDQIGPLSSTQLVPALAAEEEDDGGSAAVIVLGAVAGVALAALAALEVGRRRA